MNGSHCILWIDHEKAKLMFVDKGEPISIAISSPHAHAQGNIHHKAGVLGSGKSALDGEFVRQIERHLLNCREFIVVGPGTAKLEFIRHVHRHASVLDDRLVGVETLDHVSDGQLADFARAYFRRYDRLHASNEDVLAGHAAHRQ